MDVFVRSRTISRSLAFYLALLGNNNTTFISNKSRQHVSQHEQDSQNISVLSNVVAHVEVVAADVEL
jgi:hypothetical protein